LWYQVFPEPDLKELRSRVQKALGLGCKALVVTIGIPQKTGDGAVTAGIDWSAIDRLRQGLEVPVVLKGIMSAEEARKATGMGVHGIVVSNYASGSMIGVASPLEMLPSIAEAVGGK